MKRARVQEPCGIQAENVVTHSTFHVEPFKVDPNGLAAISAISRAMEAEARAAECRALALKQLASVLQSAPALQIGK